MDNSELIGELLQELTRDVQRLQESVSKLGGQSPPDYRDQINALRQAVLSWQPQTGSAATAAESSQILAQLGQLTQSLRQRPEYTISQFVRYGGYAFGLMVIGLVVMTWLALDWKQERDQYAPAYEAANWRVRYTQQANPDFYAYMEGIFAKDASKVQQWTLEQEQADQKRELARQAAEQAKAMNAQADQLERKSIGKGKKKKTNE